MTRTPSPPLMAVMCDQGPRLVLVASLALCLLASPSQAQVESTGAPQEGEGRILITLHARESPHGNPPELLYAYVFNSTIQGNQSHREIHASLPDGAELREFRVYQAPHIRDPQTHAFANETGRWAAAEWDHEGPLPGTGVAMRLDAARIVDPHQEIHIEWDRFNTTLTSIRLAIPATHTPEVDPDHEIQREDSLLGLNVWNLTNPPSDRLVITIHPMGEVDDPSLGDPPPAWGAYAVLIALILFSASIWFIGKKADTKRSHRDAPPPPE